MQILERLGCHPEWNKNLVKAVNGGSYFDNPNFGNEAIQQNGTDTSSNEDTDTSNKNDLMKWPTDGTNITSKFGLRDAPTAGASTNHRGIDIGVPEGTNVYACESGKVTTASSSESAGNWIVIDHGNGYVSKYMHNSQLKVSVGDKVEKGQVIALSGNTGHSTGPHLHFQLEYEGSAVDPLSFKYDNDMGDGTEGVGANTDSSSTTIKYYAKVATWTENTIKVESDDPEVSGSSDTSYSMTTTNVNYRDMVKGYTMPFDYLWAMLVVSGDKDFVMQLADLVYGSEIEIKVYDNLEIDTDVTVDTYTRKTKTVTDAKVTVNYGVQSASENAVSVTGNWEDEKENNYKIITTEITKTNTLDVSLAKADVWLLKYTQQYTHQRPNTTTTTNRETLENIEYPNEPNSTSSEDTYGHAQNLLNTQKTNYQNAGYTYVDGRIDSVQSKIYKATVNRNKEIKNTVKTTNYIKGTGKTVEKTKVDAKKDNFVKILAKPECKTARINIKDVSSWLFEILESNETTKDMVDITKYLLYKSYNKSYGVKEFDFSEYETANFSDYSNSSNSESSVATGGVGTIGVYTATNGKKYNLYLQGSGAPWANEDYGDSHNMAAAGCGPTAGAIIASSYNADITPSTFRKAVVDLYGLGNHSSPTWIGNAFKKLLPQVNTEVGSTFDENKIKQCLKNSGQVWLIVNKKYTSASHCIALIDYKENSQGQGMVYVAHGTAKSRPYGWDTLNTVKSCYKPSGLLYIGGK